MPNNFIAIISNEPIFDTLESKRDLNKTKLVKMLGKTGAFLFFGTYVS